MPKGISFVPQQREQIKNISTLTFYCLLMPGSPASPGNPGILKKSLYWRDFRGGDPRAEMKVKQLLPSGASFPSSHLRLLCRTPPCLQA